jgi:hypothetical protein
MAKKSVRRKQTRSGSQRKPRLGTKAFNESVVRSLYEDLYNQGYFTQIEKIKPIIGPNFRDLGPNSPRVGRGPTAFAACNEMLAYIPGEVARWKVNEIVSEGQKVVVRWSAVKGETTSSGITIYDINKRGQIDRAFTEWNPLNILRNTGRLPEGLGDQGGMRLR